MNKSKSKTDRARNNQPYVTDKLGCEVISHLNYLSSVITNGGGCQTETQKRFEMARSATTKLTNMWGDKDIAKNTKLKLIKSLVFPIAIYACDLEKAGANLIKFFEMWLYSKNERFNCLGTKISNTITNNHQQKHNAKLRILKEKTRRCEEADC